MQSKAVMTWCQEEFVDPGILSRAGIQLEIRKCLMNDEDQLIAAARDADAVIIVGVQPYSRHVLAQLERCRLIEVLGNGHDGVDVAAATELGICIGNNPNYCTEELAEHTLALILTFARRIIQQDRAVRDGRWDKLVSPEIKSTILSPIRRVSTLTLGVIGLGNSGRMLAKRARAFGLRVIAHTPPTSAAKARELDIPIYPLNQLLQEADFVSVNAALTHESRSIIGLTELRLMKPTAYLLNTARGGLIDQSALITALAEGWIAGAGLDVMEPEPLPMESPLLKLDNVILTPHSAYFSQESEAGLWEHPFEEVVRVLNGRWPVALANPGVKEAYIKKWGSML